jgi:4-amino-4-deoxy-L-arabinose transferase-like glycosyltransferase
MLRRRLLLALLFVVLCTVSTIWVLIDRRPPEWDHANHLERAVDCYRNLRMFSGSGAREILEASSFYPPLVTCAAGALYFVFPIAPLVAQAVMMGFLGLAMACVYALGRRLAGAETGLWAAFFLGTAPFVVFSLTNFQLDLPLASMVALALYALVRAEAFAEPRWSLALGVALGLGMLTKPPFAIYVLPPFLWSLWRAIRSPERARRLGWAAAALSIAAALALPWYGPRLFGLPMQILSRSFKQAAEQQNPEPLTAAGLLYYPRTLPTQFGLLAGLLLVWGLWAIRRNRASRPLLWLATLAPFAAFSLIQNKNLRYTLPILPAAALVAAIGLGALPVVPRRWIGTAAVLLGALQVSMALFLVPAPPTLPGMILPMALGRAPSGADWQHDKVLADLGRESGGRPVTVAVIPNDNFFSVSNFRYEVVRRGLPYRMTRAWSDAPLGVDFVILKSGDQGPAYSAARPERLTRAFAGGDPYWVRAFPVVSRYALPDGSVGVLRVRRIPPLAGVTPAAVAARLERDPAALLSAFVRDAQNLRVTLDYRAEDILRGRVERATITATAATVGELARRGRAPLRVRDVRLEVDGLVFNPQRLMAEGRLEILDAAVLRIRSLVVTEEDLRELLQGQPVGRGMTISLRDGAALVRTTRLGPALEAVARFGPGDGDRPLTLSLDGVRLGGLPVPGPLVDWVVRHLDPTLSMRHLPVPLELGPIGIAEGRVVIGGS